MLSLKGGSEHTSDVAPANISPDQQPQKQERDPLENVLLGDRLAQGIAAIASVTGALISLPTVFLVWRAFLLQEDATKHALSAADAARESAWITQRLGEGQSKAYVHATGAYIGATSRPPLVESVLADLIFGNNPSVRLTIENTGQTIATNVSVEFEIGCEAAEPEWRKHRPLPESPIKKDVPNIAPKQTPEVTLMFSVKSALDLFFEERLSDDRLLVTLRGEIYYDDVFENRYRSAFVCGYAFIRQEPLPPGAFEQRFLTPPLMVCQPTT